MTDERLKWIVNQLENIKRAAMVQDFCRDYCMLGEKPAEKANDLLCDFGLSILMVAMGEHIPKTLWSVDDYSELYTILDQHKDDLNLTDRE